MLTWEHLGYYRGKYTASLEGLEMALGLPRVNGAVGMVLKLVAAYLSGPGKMVKVETDICIIKTKVSTMELTLSRIEGYLQGRRDAERP